MPTTPRSSRSSPRTTPSATTRCDPRVASSRSEEHTSELQSRSDLVCRLLLEKKKINRVYKHLKPSAKNQQGGRLSKEMPIDVSNVLLYCPAFRRGVRVGHRFTAAGQKQRYYK